MREIKFRQWIGDRFVYWGIDIDGCTFIGPASGGGANPAKTPHQQCTGLKDKNGTPVYEGDILCFVPIGHKKFNKPYQPFVIFWDEKAARFSDWSPKEGERGAVVIGNVFEHPDLLK